MFLRRLIVAVVIIACGLVALIISKLLGTDVTRSMQIALFFMVGALVVCFIWLKYRNS